MMIKRKMNYFIVCALLLSPALYAMELVQDIELQPLINQHASTHSSIKSMQQGIAHQAKKNMNAMRREAEKYLNVTFPGQSAWIGEGQEGLRFNQLAQSYQSLSPDCQWEVWKHMSEGQQLLHRFALLMPDVFYNTCTKANASTIPILVFMLDGDREAADFFSSMPLVEIFDLYYQIKRDLGDENKPVGPLLRLSPEDRNKIIKTINPSFSYLALTTKTTQKHLENLPEDIKDTYLKGHTLQIIDIDTKDLPKTTVAMCSLTLLAASLVSGAAAGAGVCFCKDATVVLCSNGFLGGMIGAVFGIPSSLLAFLYCSELVKGVYHAHEITM